MTQHTIKMPKQEVSYEYKAQVLRVVDGDTIDFLIDLGFECFHKERVRLYGIDAPEIRTRNKTEKAKGKEATAFVCDKLSYLVNDKLDIDENPIVTIRSYKEDKYGRYLVMVYYIENGKKYCLNQQLLNAGLAKLYEGGKRK